MARLRVGGRSASGHHGRETLLQLVERQRSLRRRQTVRQPLQQLRELGEEGGQTSGGKVREGERRRRPPSFHQLGKGEGGQIMGEGMEALLQTSYYGNGAWLTLEAGCCYQHAYMARTLGISR